jgi:serine kinase of HPr protein (carbohydrate metabolism regulator)
VTVHASAVLIGSKAALIRGPSGSGKSRLAFDLIEAARQGVLPQGVLPQGALPFARLVADDRADIENRSGRLLVRPAPAIAGLIEVRGLGIRRLPYEPVAVVGLVVDLAALDAERHPGRVAAQTMVERVTLPRLAVAARLTALPLVLAFLGTPAAD